MRPADWESDNAADIGCNEPPQSPEAYFSVSVIPLLKEKKTSSCEFTLYPVYG
jgi:hypothetical protein